MRFKEPKLQEQFNNLTKVNPKLWHIIDMLDLYCTLEFKQDICVTHVFRTQAEHEALYAQTPVANRPLTSPHMFNKAVDIRDTDFNDAQKKKMLSFLNCFTYKSGQGKPVAILHAIAGNVFHFHVQAD